MLTIPFDSKVSKEIRRACEHSEFCHCIRYMIKTEWDSEADIEPDILRLYNKY